jgi:DNA polymerase-3 subunit delta'
MSIMHSILIIGQDKQRRQEEAKILAKKHNADFIFKLSQTDKKHSIASIREVIKSFKTKHFMPGRARAILIEEAQNLTDEAANAFLKTLEEPPENTLIILTAPSKESVLETIASRCFITDLGHSSLPDKNFLQDAEKLFEKICSSRPGEKFLLIEKLNSRQEATDFVVGQIYAARKILLQSIFNKTAKSFLQKEILELVNLLENLEKGRQDLESNVNIRLTLTNLILNYPSS